MESKDLNSRILEKVNAKVAFTNLEMEETCNMKRTKKAFGILAMCAIVLVGGVFSVNAATDGKVFKAVSAFIIRNDGTKNEIPFEEKEINGETFYQFNYESEDKNSVITATVAKDSKDEDGRDINTEITIDEESGETSLVFTNSDFKDVTVNENQKNN